MRQQHQHPQQAPPASERKLKHKEDFVPRPAAGRKCLSGLRRDGGGGPAAGLPAAHPPHVAFASEIMRSLRGWVAGWLWASLEREPDRKHPLLAPTACIILPLRRPTGQACSPLPTTCLCLRARACACTRTHTQPGVGMSRLDWARGCRRERVRYSHLLGCSFLLGSRL